MPTAGGVREVAHVLRAQVAIQVILCALEATLKAYVSATRDMHSLSLQLDVE
jgi:hypothetical protein